MQKNQSDELIFPPFHRLQFDRRNDAQIEKIMSTELKFCLYKRQMTKSDDEIRFFLSKEPWKMGVYRSNRPWENVFIPRYSGFNAGENVLSNIKSNVLDFVYESLKISFFLLWLLKKKHGSKER